jgi:hypothetical protein
MKKEEVACLQSYILQSGWVSGGEATTKFVLQTLSIKKDLINSEI